MHSYIDSLTPMFELGIYVFSIFRVFEGVKLYAYCVR